jgi:hypothetical protein
MADAHAEEYSSLGLVCLPDEFLQATRNYLQRRTLFGKASIEPRHFIQ